MKKKTYSASYVKRIKRELKNELMDQRSLAGRECARADHMAKRLSLAEFFVNELTRLHPDVARLITETHG
jgi:sensor c-di-GMP phosphodiesterase-like protein